MKKILFTFIRILGFLDGCIITIVGITIFLFSFKKPASQGVPVWWEIFYILLGILLLFPWRLIKKTTTFLYLMYCYAALALFFAITNFFFIYQALSILIIFGNLYIFYLHYRNLLTTNISPKYQSRNRGLWLGFFLLLITIVFISMGLSYLASLPKVNFKPIENRLTLLYPSRKFEFYLSGKDIFNIVYFDPKFNTSAEYVKNFNKESYSVGTALCSDKELKEKYKYNYIHFSVKKSAGLGIIANLYFNCTTLQLSEY